MTEEQIERAIEVRMDRLDKRFLAGAITEAEYEAETLAINDWAVDQMDRQCGRTFTFTNAETGMQAQVIALKAGYHVRLVDLDSGEQLPETRMYSDANKAHRCASHWAGAQID